ncbi:MAG TPA: MraY family glycosyltransferase [Actinomycetota bacterium]|nr:MraY family glycosyltransferase [Actinomycetota bacterium]
MLAYVGVFLVSAAAVAVVTPVVRRVAVRLGTIDRPSDRKVHPKPTPIGGGVGLLFGVAAGMGVAALVPSLRSAFRVGEELQGTLLAALVITAVGLIDDIVALSAPAKIAGQVLAAGLLILTGVELLFFWFPFGQGVIVVGSDLAVPLTVAWVVLMVNAVNLLDGLDGLAAGMVVIAATAFFIYLYRGPTPFAESATSAKILAAVTAGAAFGFLPYNSYPARIFMGDSGSMLLGLLLASATISGVGRTVQPSGGDIAAFSIPVLIPAIVLAVPLLDVALAVIRRLRRGRPVFAPDKEHIHHQLQQIGHTHRRAVLIMYIWGVLAAGSALAITYINGRLLVSAVLAAAFLLMAATVVPARLRERAQARRARELAAQGSSSTSPAAMPGRPS